VPIATATLPFITATVTSLICIFIDTAYFHSSLNFTLKPQSMPPSLRNLTSFIFNLSVTPLNFVSYNLNSENLAEHGLHPRWLHLFVNLPLVIGLGLVWYGFREGVTSLRSSVLRETKVIIDRKGQRKKIWQRGAALKYTVNVTQCLNKSTCSPTLDL
jgi:phosphatidylinositol glycan class Z